jgi:MHS family alpha-ketoglutarate permease-like MFS transporter
MTEAVEPGAPAISVQTLVGLTPLARVKAILGGSAGNMVEWYDWFAYASFSLYFAKVFFPKGDQTEQLLQTAAVFAVGFFARPVGAWVMGVYADRAGRKAALVASVALMCLGSLAVAVMPGYAVIGAAAPLILVVARLVQGLSVGGEYGASATYMSEMAGNARRGFWSSFQFVTIIGGQIAALVVLIVLQRILTKDQLEDWGWRVPFVIGALLAVVVFWIQHGLEETRSFEAGRTQSGRGSTARLLFGHPIETAMVFVLSAAGGLSFYCFTTYMQKFLTNTAHFSRDTAAEISAASLVVYLLIIPLFGWLGDKVGRRALLVAAFGLGALAVWPIMTGIAGAANAGVALALVCAAVAIMAGYSAVSAVVKAELFPTHVRALGVALPYALGNAAFGGTAEFVAEAFKKAGHESGFYIYVGVIQAVACLVALRMRDTQRRSLLVED